ncbi:MAG: chemotaxis protein CheW [Candidatus Bruticola sp.]
MKQFGQQQENNTVLTFKLGESNFAVPVHCVARVEQAAALTKVPNMPDYIMGLLNHHGTIIPVIDIRSVFAIKIQPLHPGNQFIIINAKMQNLAFVTDRIIGLSYIVSQTDMNSLIKNSLKITSAITDTNRQVFLFLSPEKLLEPFDLEKIRRLVLQSQ